MKTHGHPCRKPLLTTLAVVALMLLGSQAVVAGLHLACHAHDDATGPVHACAVCAHFWLSPAALEAATVLPLPLSVTAPLPPSLHVSPAPAPAQASVRAPPADVS